MRRDGLIAAKCGDDEEGPRPEPGRRFTDFGTSYLGVFCLCFMWYGDKPNNRDVSFTSHVVAATWQTSRSGEGTEYIRKRGVMGSKGREDGELNLD